MKARPSRPKKISGEYKIKKAAINKYIEGFKVNLNKQEDLKKLLTLRGLSK